MTVDELLQLCKWLNQNLAPNITAFSNLSTVLTQNAQNSPKQPLREQLKQVETALRAMPIEELTAEQTDLLEQNSVLEYLGPDGWRWVQSLIREGDYDPSTAASEMHGALTIMQNTVTSFDDVVSSLKAIGLSEPKPFSRGDGIITRIHFKDKADITDVVALKRWSAEWNDIARGLATAVGEKPEDVRVVGAATGSLILILSVPLAIVKLIVSLSKSANTIATNTLSILNGMEDLRHKKVLNQAMEAAMRAEVDRIKTEGASTALIDVKALLPKDIKPDQEKLLKVAVEKYFSFTEKGGEVDMLAPPTPTDEETEVVDGIENLRVGIEEVRKLNANLQLLIASHAEE